MRTLATRMQALSQAQEGFVTSSPQGKRGKRRSLQRTLRPAHARFYFTSTVAPASVNFFLMVSASSLLTPSLMAFGAASTKSLASFRPRLVTSRTALITLILLAPTAVRTTENSVFSSAGAAAGAAPPAAAPAITTGAAAAAETPSASSRRFTKSAASSKVRPLISSTIFSTRSDIVFTLPDILRNLFAEPAVAACGRDGKLLILPRTFSRQLPV